MLDVILSELYETHKAFFSEFIKDEKALEKFIKEKIECKISNIPRRMINTIQRLLTLSDDIGKVRPNREDLKVFFIVTCIESLYTLRSEYDNLTLKKQDMVIDFCENYIGDDDKELIKDGFEINFINEEPALISNINMEQFGLLLCSIRNCFVHEGTYWSFSFKNEQQEREYPELTIISTLESKLIRNQGYKKITYGTRIKYSDFRAICIRGLINFLNSFYVENCI